MLDMLSCIECKCKTHLHNEHLTQEHNACTYSQVIPDRLFVQSHCWLIRLATPLVNLIQPSPLDWMLWIYGLLLFGEGQEPFCVESSSAACVLHISVMFLSTLSSTDHNHTKGSCLYLIHESAQSLGVFICNGKGCWGTCMHAYTLTNLYVSV